MTITESTDKTGDDMSFFDRWSRREDEELLALAIKHTPYNRELGRFDPSAAEHIAPLWIAIRETPRWRNAGLTLENAVEKLTGSMLGERYNDAGEKILSRSTRRSFKRIAADARKDGRHEGAAQLEKLAEAGVIPREETA